MILVGIPHPRHSLKSALTFSSTPSSLFFLVMPAATCSARAIFFPSEFSPQSSYTVARLKVRARKEWPAPTRDVRREVVFFFILNAGVNRGSRRRELS